MGLDMYLEARKYVSKTDWVNLEQIPNSEYDKVQEFFPVELTKHADSGSTVGVNVAYWRKANQIHGWFVNNVQNGEDDCKEYYVTDNKLAELLDTVNKVLEDKQSGSVEVAKELLPVTSGCFFGNYDEEEGYDDWYFEQLQYTKEMLETVLPIYKDSGHELKGISLYYSSSW